MKRQTRSAAFKRKVALEAIKERKTANEIASIHGIHPVQVSNWKKQLVEGAHSIFESPIKARKDLLERADSEARLHEKIGRLTVELDWLKKKVGDES